MSDRIQVTVEKETKKALLVSAEGKKGWIQRRWARDDLTVNIATFEKAATAFERNQRDREARQNWRNDYHQFSVENIAKESEKAIAFDTWLKCVNTDQCVKRLAWFPKSQIVDNAIPGWLIDAKVDQLREEEKERYRGDLSIEIQGLIRHA